jgi:hypothetical protein
MRATGASSPATVAVSQRTLGRSKALRSVGWQPVTTRGHVFGGDVGPAVREGNALEGVASARRAWPRVLRDTARHKTR